MPATSLRRAATPFAIFAACAAVYVVTLGPRISGRSDNAHYVYLAQSLLHGKLALLADHPPGDNDWTFYRGHWYVTFPPFPALLIAPLVALFDTAVWDRLFWALLAGVAPALLYVLLRALSKSGLSERSARENLLLTALYAFGSPFYYTAVQGTVWFAAHVVGSVLTALYVFWALAARRPLLAGTALGLAFMTRPSTLLLAPFFAFEALRSARLPDRETPLRVADLARGLDRRRVLGKLLLFALPLLVMIALNMWMNAVRFGDPFEPGYAYLNIRWRSRITTWGLFNYHYLSKNLAVFLASLPWLSAFPPYLKLSRHGLALWFTTPPLLCLLWPQRRSLTATALYISAGAVALTDLCYQNSGWVQFAYRFSLDYAIALFVLLALGGVRFGKLFYALCAWSLVVNTFGALTFDRMERFYDGDPTQQVVFQPD